jgi:hypothetical protein
MLIQILKMFSANFLDFWPNITFRGVRELAESGLYVSKYAQYYLGIESCSSALHSRLLKSEDLIPYAWLRDQLETQKSVSAQQCMVCR